MATVQLDDEEWQRVINIIATAPWNTANPLLMKIGQQLQAAHHHPNPMGLQAAGNGKETTHE